MAHLYKEMQVSDEVKKSLGRFVIDIETNNLLSNMLDYSSLPYKLNSDARLWCIVVRDVDTDDVKEIVSENGSSITKDDLQRILSDCSELIGHNAIKFDLLALKLFGVLDYDIGYLDQSDKLFGKEIKVTDTLLRSRLLNPDRKGGHSLGAWGKVLGDFKGDFHDFSKFTPEMLSYCIQDTKVTSLIFDKLEKEYQGYIGWKKAEKMENKLADIAVRRETYGFWFDKEKAIACVEDLTEKMKELSDNVNPLLPPKPMTKGTLKKYTPPIKQINKDGSVSAIMAKFAIRHDAIIEDELFIYKGMAREIPFTEPLETHEVADISDLDHVKSYLIELGWRPMEMKIRDLTKDSKKQSISYEKRVETLDRWLAQTFDEGKYKDVRLRDLDMGMKVTKEEVRKKLLPKLEKDFPVRVPTSPCVRVGVEKELCPNLTKLGDKVAFANDFVLYQTYKHRKSSIAGGKLDDVDYEDEYPDTGYLSMYREEDERVSTPAIEIGAGTQRYRHISIANIPRVTSVYGEELRSLFGCGKGMYQFGFDFSSLEARIQGHYVLPFNGEELAVSLLAEKPNDLHSINARKLGMDRGDAKAIAYMLIYGGSSKKAKTMLGITQEEADALVENFWEEVKPLKDLKEALTAAWEKRGKTNIVAVDGRKINIRSQHSLINFLFQSGGVICAKYSTVFLYKLLEEQGYKCNPFEHEVIDMSSMIEYHDECQLAVNPKLIPMKLFKTEEDCNKFIEEWDGEQLGEAIVISDGRYCLALPNPISKAVTDAITLAEKEVGLKVNLGMSYVVGNNWALCH